MRKIYFIASLFILWSGCKKEETTTTNTTPKITAIVDGTAWSATTQIIASKYGNVLSIDGLKTSSDQIGIDVEAAATGTYSLGASGSGYASYMKYNSSKGYNVVYSTKANSGTVTITELTSTSAKGTFSYTAYYTSLGVTDSVKVTNGEFLVKYTAQQ